MKFVIMKEDGKLYDEAGNIVPKEPIKVKWGNWYLTDKISLEFCPDWTWKPHEGVVWYEVDLERMWDAAACLDWVFQVYSHISMKNSIQDLIQAIHDIIDPQANLCSMASVCGRAPFGLTYNRTKTKIKIALEEYYKKVIEEYGESWWESK